jgi:tetratricopeptide (TPR) repeat protein
MNGRPLLGLLAFVTAGLAAIPLQPQDLSGQGVSDRFRVMVVEIQPQGNADKKFGERLAKELRDLIDDMERNQAIGDKDLKRALRDYGVDMEDMDCVRSVQLAPLIDAQVVFCGGYTQQGESYVVQAEFISQGGEKFVVDPVTVPVKDGQKQAAAWFHQALQVQNDQNTSALFCAQYASSQQWDNAMENCDRSIALNPNAVASRFTRAQVLRNMDREDEALEEFVRVIELDALNEDALQLAGALSANLGQKEEARGYYNRYLELNPANANIRMNIAYDLAQAGDPLGAMQFIDVGLEIDPENVDLLKQHGGFAFTAGAEASIGFEGLPPEAVELYKKALASFSKVYDLEGADMDAGYLRNMVAAHINLGEYQDAVDLSERVLQTHADEFVLWSFYADALQKVGKLDEAIAALDRVVALNPDYPSVGARQGKWLLDEGRVEEAVPILRAAVERGEQTADAACNFVWNHGILEGVQPEKWSYAIDVLRLAKDFEISDDMRQQVDFYLGYSILKNAISRQEPQTKETALATLPRFQEALRLLQTTAGFAQKRNMENDRVQLISNINTYIEIQEAIIKRGR